jgi:hypothetical protein
VGSNPTPSAILYLLMFSWMSRPMPASASEIIAGIRLNNYSGITRQSIARMLSPDSICQRFRPGPAVMPLFQIAPKK